MNRVDGVIDSCSFPAFAGAGIIPVERNNINRTANNLCIRRFIISLSLNRMLNRRGRSSVLASKL